MITMIRSHPVTVHETNPPKSLNRSRVRLRVGKYANGQFVGDRVIQRAPFIGVVQTEGGVPVCGLFVRLDNRMYALCYDFTVGYFVVLQGTSFPIPKRS